MKHLFKRLAAFGVLALALMGLGAPTAFALPAEGSGSAIYLDGENGADTNDGGSANAAVSTFTHAKELAQANREIKTIYVSGEVQLPAGEVSLAGTDAIVKRAPSYTGALFNVSGVQATLAGITIDGNASEVPRVDKPLVTVADSGALTIQDGTILRNNAAKSTRIGGLAKGGAVEVSQASVTMTGGLIENNQANNGGGIGLSYRATLTMTGGTIRNNRAVTGLTGTFNGNFYQIYDVAGAGGGVHIDDLCTMNLSGGTIEHNSADEVGGAISAGNLQRSRGAKLIMTGGTLDANSCGATGGALFVQAGDTPNHATAKITGGAITNNAATGKGQTNNMFGGGGIYVNGYASQYGLSNGELYLENALITENSAKYEGGGYAACPVSVSRITIEDGTALLRNTTESGRSREIYILAAFIPGGHGGDPSYKIPERMLGGLPNNWKDNDNALLPLDQLEGTLHSTELSVHTDEQRMDAAKALAKVVIKGNTSVTRGGGIGSNGSVFIGKQEEHPKNLLIEKTWEQGLEAHEVTVELHAKAGGTDWVVETVTLNADNDFKHVVKNLPSTIGGQPIEDVLYVTEPGANARDVEISPVTPYQAGADDTSGQDPIHFSVSVLNKLPETVSVPVTKVWNDENDHDGKRPEKVVVHLLANGEDSGLVLELSADNNWKGSFNDLPKYNDDAGNSDKAEIVYTVSEDKVPDYTTKITGDAASGFTIENTHTPPQTPPVVPPHNPPTNPPTNPPHTPNTPPSAPKPQKHLPATGDSAWAAAAALGTAASMLAAGFVLKQRRS